GKSINSWIMKSPVEELRYSAASVSLYILFTRKPRSPISGLKITGKVKFSFKTENNSLCVAGYRMNRVLGNKCSGTRLRISNFDSPNMPPKRMEGFEAEKKNNERALSESHNQ